MTLALSLTVSSSSLQMMTNHCKHYYGNRIAEEKLTGSTFSSSNLGKSRLHLGVQGISGHDENHRKVLINQGEGPMLEFTGKNLVDSVR